MTESTQERQHRIAQENLRRLKEFARRRGRNRNAHTRVVEKRRRQAEAVREITNAKPLAVPLVSLLDQLPTQGH